MIQFVFLPKKDYTIGVIGKIHALTGKIFLIMLIVTATLFSAISCVSQPSLREILERYPVKHLSFYLLSTTVDLTEL